MLGLRYPLWANFLWFQIFWFIAVIGRERTIWVLPILLLIHLAMCKDWRAEIKIMLLAAAIGVLMDSALTWSGVFIFDEARTILPIPLWLIAIWFAFSGTLRHSLAFLLARPALASVGAGIFAPISYIAGKHFGAVTFGPDTWVAGTIIALLWICFIQVLVYITNITPRSGSED